MAIQPGDHRPPLSMCACPVRWKRNPIPFQYGNGALHVCRNHLAHDCLLKHSRDVRCFGTGGQQEAAQYLVEVGDQIPEEREVSECLPGLDVSARRIGLGRPLLNSVYDQRCDFREVPTIHRPALLILQVVSMGVVLTHIADPREHVLLRSQDVLDVHQELILRMHTVYPSAK